MEKPDVVGVDLLDAPRRLVEQRGNAQRLRVVLQEDLAQVRERKPVSRMSSTTSTFLPSME
jgi:hypothetical protein